VCIRSTKIIISHFLYWKLTINLHWWYKLHSINFPLLLYWKAKRYFLPPFIKTESYENKVVNPGVISVDVAWLVSLVVILKNEEIFFTTFTKTESYESKLVNPGVISVDIAWVVALVVILKNKEIFFHNIYKDWILRK
jgi:uncharacterized membrane protein YobD (UPF0266 family)